MKILQAGANVLLENQKSATVTTQWQPTIIQGCTVDASAFLLQAHGKVRADTDFIFYNQPRNPEGSVQLFVGPEAIFKIDLDNLSRDIEKISFALTIHGQANFSQGSSVRIRLDEQVIFSPEVHTLAVSALILGELYRRDHRWKWRAMGQGFAGGLAPLATHFGVMVDDQPAAAQPLPHSPRPASPPVTNWLKNSVARAKETLTNEVTKFMAKDLLEAMVAGCALVAYADGHISTEEKQKMLGFLRGSEQLKVFAVGDVIQRFQNYIDQLNFDIQIGTDVAMSAIVKFKDKPQAQLLVSVCCAIGAADGHFDDNEKAMVRRIIQTLNLNPASFVL